LDTAFAEQYIKIDEQVQIDTGQVHAHIVGRNQDWRKLCLQHAGEIYLYSSYCSVESTSMSPATISAAIGGLVITALVLAFFFQWRQKHREARLRRLHELKARDRRLRNLADGLPGGLIPADIRLLLSRSGLEIARELKELGLAALAEEASVDWQAY